MYRSYAAVAAGSSSAATMRSYARHSNSSPVTGHTIVERRRPIEVRYQKHSGKVVSFLHDGVSRTHERSVAVCQRTVREPQGVFESSARVVLAPGRKLDEMPRARAHSMQQPR